MNHHVPLAQIDTNRLSADQTAPSDETLTRFIAALERDGYRGDIARDRATRTVNATDNSIYELLPRLVLHPREGDDLNRIMRAAHETAVPLVARGGGTGTNGQSLTESVIVDCSRHLTAIEAIDPARGIAIVQPGVILDQLNREAGKHGLFFAPTVSTSSRATLGGMAATDASGKGSRIHGRTSDHVIAMEVALADGSDWRAETLSPEALETVCAREDLAGAVHRTVREVIATEADEIDRVFPVMNRGLTGYNLDEIVDAAGDFHLGKLLAGSEGTLALTKRLTLKLTRKKAHRALVVVAYDDVLEALGDVERLVAPNPVAIEFVDDKVVRLAQDDPIWGDIEAVLAHEGPRAVRGLNFIEVEHDSLAEIDATLAAFAALSATAPASVVSETVVREPKVISQLWALRAKGVGLLGRMDPTRQGTAFVEDAAVPPENLAAFVAGFRDILDANGVAFGMYGHADVGCVHVRPALDMRIPEDAAKIRPISDAVHKLALTHGGLIWGEHGKGFRGEYVPDVFGARLYAALCRIKAAFDPAGLLNPGKIAAGSPDAPLRAIDVVPFRGPLDAAITPERLDGFEKAVKCNGNGACFNRDYDDVMCPSYKASGDRRQSPKGRAALLREWLRPEREARTLSGLDDGGPLDAQLDAALATCLGCKACASQCPVKVDIPAMRSRFYADYYRNHRRPPHHHLLAMMERMAPLMRAAPGLANIMMRAGGPVLRAVGLVDLPAVRTPRRSRRPLHAPADARAVLLVEDTFLSTFDGGVIDAAETLLERLGYTVLRAAPVANGKAFHVLGMREAFDRTARRAIAHARELQALGLPVIALEPAVRDLWRDEYREHGSTGEEVRSLEAFLLEEADAGHLGERRDDGDGPAVKLFLHCTEKTSDPQAAERWRRLLAHFGVAARVQATGCCGMAGTFGHERQNLAMSRAAFDLSWRDRLEEPETIALATGFSCRSQIARFGAISSQHPVEFLSARIAA
ncbi:FAD-binding oxidoreductase [Acuticoccus sp. M5D2P5]|uniref:FAD-binding and (Fe-S)-binding domain-containing protein n=1 Tax=Acuticoccus kalidii TaxID=2910977 RepID=UPI001F2A5FD1|nr:FAD-binding and (Fe-S)-binding domain-containing protein [Acuticoccus kalidii]MCF3934771.1 FAD-binding oxidoreductase [Acuticoccus kalidii]